MNFIFYNIYYSTIQVLFTIGIDYFYIYLDNHTLEYLIFLDHEPGHLQTFEAFEGDLTSEHFPEHLSQKSRAKVSKQAMLECY